MIQRRNLYSHSPGLSSSASALNVGWLRTAISSAASKAGYPGWCLADDVAIGITAYLQDSHAGLVIDRPQLERAVRGFLCDVGYGEVAVFFRTHLPSRRISLKNCVSKLKQNNRAEFFDVLAERILELQSSDVAHIHFSDLKACVRGLLRIPAPSQRDDEHLALKVVDFVREKVLALFQKQEVWCSVT